MKVSNILILAGFILGALLLPASAEEFLESPILKERVAITTDEDYLHPHSEISIPKSIDGMERISLNYFDERKYQVGAGYSNDAPRAERVTVSLFIYPAHVTAQSQADLELLKTDPAKYIQREMDMIEVGIAYLYTNPERTKSPGFKTDIGPALSRCWTFDSGVAREATTEATCATVIMIDEKWFVKTRASGPPSEQEKMEEYTNKLLQMIEKQFLVKISETETNEIELLSE